MCLMETLVTCMALEDSKEAHFEAISHCALKVRGNESTSGNEHVPACGGPAGRGGAIVS